MKWSKKDLDICLNLLKNGKSYKEIGLIINRDSSSIRSRLFKVNEKSSKYLNRKKDRIFICLNCDKSFKDNDGQNRIFCSQKCNGLYYGDIKSKSTEKPLCINCGKECRNKYCSQKCVKIFQQNQIFKEIENGNINLYYRHYKKYLIHKYGEKCMDCGWSERNKKTGNVPINIEHINGDSSNNSLSNLKLLCPNCHSLTETYGSLNKGKGRPERQKYRNSIKKLELEELINELSTKS